MKVLRKRVSVSLPADLLDLIDRQSRDLRRARSQIVEDWLRGAAERGVWRKLDEEIEAAYQYRTDPERVEDEAIARALGRAARQLQFDEEVASDRRGETRRGARR